MVSTQPQPGVPVYNPQKILDMNYSFARTMILLAAVRLRLFTHLEPQLLTATELAARTDTTPTLLERLLQGLITLELIEKTGEHYSLTPLAAQYLVEGKASYLGGDTLAMEDYFPAWLELDRSLRDGKPYRELDNAACAEDFFAPRVRDLFPLVYPIADRTFASLSLPFPKHRSLQVLDVGAGSAPWSAAFTSHYPSSLITALDLPAVVEQGKKQIAMLGLTERYRWLAADMETVDLPAQAYDLIIVGFVCRFLSDEQVKALLPKLERSLQPGGTLLLADAFFADDHQGPPAAITIDLSMLVNTAQGRVRTCAELTSWLHESRLQHVQRVHVAGPFPLLLARRDECL